MRVPFAARIKRFKRKRAFCAKNPDIRRIYGVGHWQARRRSGSAVLTPHQRRQWNDHGVLVLRGFFTAAAAEGYKSHIDECWRTRVRSDNPVVMFGARGGHHFRDAIDEDRATNFRLQDQYLVDAPTRDLCMDPRLTAILGDLMGHAAVVCNTLLFEWGSEQGMHSDMFYMAPISENQMLATWIAIDDVTEDNGPLVYVPGSHRIPPHRFSHGKVNAIPDETADAVAATQTKMAAAGLRPERFLAKRGDVLIWHSQLVHGGSAIRDRAARRTSLVTHYFSTRDIPVGDWLCAEHRNGSLLMVKDHVAVG